MRPKNIYPWFLIIFVLFTFLRPAESTRAEPLPPNLAWWSDVTPYDLIAAMNSLRVSNGLPVLIEDPIVDAVAQYTAETMAANQMSTHIGNVRGRLAAAGYGDGATVWATENFAYGFMSIDEIMVAWSDPAHMAPATVAAYCHVGAGKAKASNGMYYYILQAAYTSEHACGPYNYPGGGTPPPNPNPVQQVIVPVRLATPDADGKIFHVVEAGQSLWAIAVAYHITIKDLEIWNNISRNTAIRIGQRLFIPGSNTVGYSTPTPVGMVVASTPDAEGRIIYTVQPYEALITIAEAYKVTVDSILSLNGLRADWPLQIGQKLLISPGWATPTSTARPLTPIEKLTPADDGNYYHIVQSGETLSWIASLYNIPLADLMAWNGLNNASIIRPDQKLILRVTPPPTLTPTPGPPTATATVTRTRRPPTATKTPTLTALSPPATPALVSQPGDPKLSWLLYAVLAAAGLIGSGLYFRKKSSQIKK